MMIFLTNNVVNLDHKENGTLTLSEKFKKFYPSPIITPDQLQRYLKKRSADKARKAVQDLKNIVHNDNRAKLGVLGSELRIVPHDNLYTFSEVLKNNIDFDHEYIIVDLPNMNNDVDDEKKAKFCSIMEQAKDEHGVLLSFDTEEAYNFYYKCQALTGKS